MLRSADPRKGQSFTPRPRGAAPRLAALLAVWACVLAAPACACAQTAPWRAEPSSLCGRENALETVRQQADAARGFGDAAQSVAVMVRAADLLWPFQQQDARAVFAEAFELAGRDFRDRGDGLRVKERRLVETPDQRFVVVRAVARRDPAWAKSLTSEMLKRQREEAEQATARSPESDTMTAWKLLRTATALLASDVGAATDFAAASFRYPATIELTRFLYEFAVADKAAADRFYIRALTAYADRPLRELLYLSAYPFGLPDAGDVPWPGTYAVPPGYAPDRAAQRLFVRALLRRARQTLEAPPDEGDNYNGFPAAAHVLQVVTRVAPQVQGSHPDLAGALEQARADLMGSLNAEQQSVFLNPEQGVVGEVAGTFDERVEAAGREPDADRRDELIVRAVLAAERAESADRLLKAAGRLSDAKLRAQVFDWLRFGGAQRALGGGRLEEARGLASKVEDLEQRAYLYAEIGAASLRRPETQGQARELAEEMAAAAARGRDDAAAARVLLAAAYLTLKFDPGRAVAVLGDAVKLVNRVESPDFTRPVMRKIDCKYFIRYAPVSTPGFDPRNVFRAMAKGDFDNALLLAHGISDKHLRALTTLDLADICLWRAEEREKAARPKKRARQ